MSKKMKWGFATLIILLLAGVSYLAIWQYTELQQYKKQAAKEDKLLEQNRKHQQTRVPRGVEVSDANYQPPPPGETDDTGHWNGNTWHRTEPPKPKKVISLKSSDPDNLYNMVLNGVLPDKYHAAEGGLHDYDGFYDHILNEYPYSRAAFEVRYQRAAGDLSGLKSMLKYYPNSPRVNAEIAWESLYSDGGSTVDAVAFGKKALQLLSESSEDYSDFSANNLPQAFAHNALGVAYQELGDYKTALVHLKSFQRILLPEVSEDAWVALSYEAIGDQIAAIRAGKPYYYPIPEVPVDVPPERVSQSVSVSETGAPLLEESSVPLNGPPRFEDASDVFAEYERADAVEHPSPSVFAEHEQQEFEGFLQWIDEIETAKSPADLDDFLMREMAKHLQGSSSKFSAERLIRAFETMQLQGQAEGMIELQRMDKELAKAMSARHKPERVPPRSRPSIKR